MDYDLDFNDGYVDSSFGKIFYKRHRAEGKKLIFLHGLGGTTKVWAKLMKQIPAEFDVSLIDLLGHGKSDSPEGIEYKISEQVQVLTEFIADQNNRESYIIGHSYGGWIAAYYASYPYTASGFVLEDSAGLEEEEEALAKMPNGHIEKEEFLKELNEYNSNEKVMRSILESSRREELTDKILASISKPTLVVWGREDKRISVKYASVLAGKISGSKLKIIEGAGHNPHYTHSEEFARTVFDFVSQIKV